MSRNRLHPGDVVKVYKFNFDPKNGEELEYRSKPRPAIVLHDDGKMIDAISVVGAYTRRGKTEQEGYSLNEEEVRISQGIKYVNADLIGVVKTNRIETFDRDEVSTTISKIPLHLKVEIVDRYDNVKGIPRHSSKLQEFNKNHQVLMQKFKDCVIAEKLNFLIDNKRNCRFEDIRHKKLELDKLQKIDERRSKTVYAVVLKDKYDSYTATITTRKNEDQILSDWSNPRMAASWLKEDEKYHALNKDIKNDVWLEPVPHPDKYHRLEELGKYQENKTLEFHR